MPTGRIVSIKKQFGQNVALGEVKDSVTGIHYTFNAPNNLFKRDEEVSYKPIDPKQDMNPGDFVQIKKKV